MDPSRMGSLDRKDPLFGLYYCSQGPQHFAQIWISWKFPGYHNKLNESQAKLLPSKFKTAIFTFISCDLLTEIVTTNVKFLNTAEQCSTNHRLWQSSSCALDCAPDRSISSSQMYVWVLNIGQLLLRWVPLSALVTQRWQDRWVPALMVFTIWH
jgi:hypothetical protein